MNEPRTPADTARPWYREPWVWLIIAIPGLTVIAGFVTLTLAIRGGDEVVTDDFRKEGVAIYRDPRRDAAAIERGVLSTLSIDRESGRIDATLSMARGEPPAELLLLLSHGTRAELDHLFVLRREAGGYGARLESLEAGRWYLELTPRDRAWRLKGMLEPGQESPLQLAPATVP
jgi:uncharacterized protein